MLRLVSLLIGSVVLAAAPAGAVSRTDPEQRLARLIEGLSAGEPVRCLDRYDVRVRSRRIIDRTAIIYDAGDTLYVNRPRAGGELLNRMDVVTKGPGDWKLCSMDRLYVSQSSNGHSAPVVLGDFVPYRKLR